MVTSNDINTTSFNSNYHNSQYQSGSAYGEFVFHNVDVFNEITIGNFTFNATYQCGQYFEHEDYNCPTTNLCLSEGGGASEFLVKIDDICESDFDNMSEGYKVELIEELQEYCNEIETIDCVHNIWRVVRENQLDANNELSSLELSDDLRDYENANDGTDYLIRK